MPLFYTGKGDKGKSHVGKQKVDKTCVEIEALGNLDELNSLLGLIKSQHVSSETKKYIGDVQEKLFIIQAYIASLLFKSKFPPPKLTAEMIKKMENIMDALEKKINPAKKFIIPGTHETSAWLDYARTVARRTERSVLLFHKKILRHSSGQEIAPEILSYLNRLSSLLFALARFENKKRGAKETHPSYK